MEENNEQYTEVEPERVEFYKSPNEEAIQEKKEALVNIRKNRFVKRTGGGPENKAFGYHFDANHEAALEANLIQTINRLGRIEGNHVPSDIVGDATSLVIEIKGFLNKWDIHESYSEKCSNYLNSYKSVDIFVMKQLYEDFVQWAKLLGFRDPVVSSENWEKRFLGF